MKFKATRVYTETKKAIKNGKTIIVHEGGSRSGKTFNVTLFLINLALKNSNIEISVCSQSLPHLKRGALKDFETIIMQSGIYAEEQYNKTDRKYTFKNGSYIEFFGVDSWGKVLGAGRDVLFVNEANKIPYVTWQQLSWRTRLLKIVDYNPSDVNHWVYELAESERGTLIHSTYRDNPFLTKEQVTEIESIADPDLFRVFVEGKRGINVTGLIFKNYEIVNSIPDNFKLLYYGMDFGYSPDPTAIVEVWSAKPYGVVYLREVMYDHKLNITQLKKRMRDVGIRKNIPIIADTNVGAILDELSITEGYWIQKAKKGSGSVKRGVYNMKRFNLLLDANSPNLIREFQTYSELVDMNGVPTGEIDMRNDHTIDCARYALDEFTRYYLPEMSQLNVM